MPRPSRHTCGSQPKPRRRRPGSSRSATRRRNSTLLPTLLRPLRRHPHQRTGSPTARRRSGIPLRRPRPRRRRRRQLSSFKRSRGLPAARCWRGWQAQQAASCWENSSATGTTAFIAAITTFFSSRRPRANTPDSSSILFFHASLILCIFTFMSVCKVHTKACMMRGASATDASAFRRAAGLRQLVAPTATRMHVAWNGPIRRQGDCLLRSTTCRGHWEAVAGGASASRSARRAGGSPIAQTAAAMMMEAPQAPRRPPSPSSWLCELLTPCPLLAAALLLVGGEPAARLA